VFLEDAEISGSLQKCEVNLVEIRVELHVPMTQETTPIIHQFVPEVSAPLSLIIIIEFPIANVNVQVDEPRQKEIMVEK
jgi:hypothetical protein